MTYAQNEWLDLPEEETTITPANRLMQIAGFSGSEYMILFKEIGRSPIWTPTNPFNNKVGVGTGTGETITSFSVNDAQYLERQVIITTTLGEKRLSVRNFGGMEYVLFLDFAIVNGADIDYKFYKNVTYFYPSVGFIKAKKDVTLGFPNYPSEGDNFELLYIASSYDIEELRGLIAAIPPRTPRYYSANSGGVIFNGETLNAVAGSVGNYGGTVVANANGTLNGTATLRYGNVLQGRGFYLEMSGNSFSLARDATIDNLNMSNGVIQGYGTVSRHIVGGSLNNVALGGSGGQNFNLYGTAITSANGFELLRDGASLNYYGTAANPTPSLPPSVVITPGHNVNIINYVGDVIIDKPEWGIIRTAPNGTRFRETIGNAGERIVNPV